MVFSPSSAGGPAQQPTPCSTLAAGQNVHQPNLTIAGGWLVSFTQPESCPPVPEPKCCRGWGMHVLQPATKTGTQQSTPACCWGNAYPGPRTIAFIDTGPSAGPLSERAGFAVGLRPEQQALLPESKRKGKYWHNMVWDPLDTSADSEPVHRLSQPTSSSA